MDILKRMMWIEKLPKPERNGFKGVLVMLSLMYGLLAPISGNNGGPMDFVLCTVMPWKCISQQTEEIKRQEYHITPIYFSKNSTNPIKEEEKKECQVDIRFDFHGETQQFTVPSDELSCYPCIDQQPYVPTGVWIHRVIPPPDNSEYDVRYTCKEAS